MREGSEVDVHRGVIHEAGDVAGQHARVGREAVRRQQRRRDPTVPDAPETTDDFHVGVTTADEQDPDGF